MQKSFNNSDRKFKQIHSLIESMDDREKEMLTDKLLSYLLFNGSCLQSNSDSTAENTAKHDLTDFERDLLKKLSDKTEELYRRMGGDFLYGM